jgi:MATE family multidrug resistance protein
VAIIISLALVFGKNLIFHLNQDPQVVAYAAPFMTLLSWSVIPSLLFMALKQFTDGLELTRVAMLLSVAALPVNAFINWLLIFGNWGLPRLELAGAGWGTLITRCLIFLILGAVILMHPAFKKYVELRSEQWNLQAQTIKQLLYIGVPSALQMGMEVAAFSVSAIIIGMIDAVSLAAHQIAISCASFTFMVAVGFSQGSSIRTSNALGRNDWERISAIGKSALLTGLLWGVFCAGSLVLFRYQLAKSFTDETSVVALAASLLLLAALFQISDSVQAISAGLLRGIKDVKYPTLLILIAYWIIGLPSGYIMTFHFKFGAAGMWLGFIAGLSFSAFFLSARFLKMTRDHLSRKRPA